MPSSVASFPIYEICPIHKIITKVWVLTQIQDEYVELVIPHVRNRKYSGWIKNGHHLFFVIYGHLFFCHRT